MDNNNNHINYTAADFERYHNGTMPEAQMYALEKAALEDPFLADALDGYVFAKTPVADIEELAQQIPPKTANKKAPVIGFTRIWLRIAAVLILVTGIGYMMYRSNYDTDTPISKTLAENKNNTIVAPANTQPAATKEDTAVHFLSTEKKVNEATANGTTATTTNQYATSAAPTQPSLRSASDYKIESEAKDLASNDDLLRAKEKTQSDLVKKMYQAPGRKYQLQGLVMNDKGEPVPFASINLKDKLSTQADANGNFSLQTKDSMMLANISAVGYAAVNQNLSTNNQQNNIILGRKQNNLDEVVVTAMGVQKQRKDLGSATAEVRSEELLKGKVAGVAVQNVQPVQGMAKYDLYLDSSRLQMAVPAPPLKGQVILSFKVNRQGVPIHIKVEKSLSTEYDQAAIRLLKEGPKWQFSHGKRTTKTIEF